MSNWLIFRKQNQFLQLLLNYCPNSGSKSNILPEVSSHEAFKKEQAKFCVMIQSFRFTFWIIKFRNTFFPLEYNQVPRFWVLKSPGTSDAPFFEKFYWSNVWKFCILVSIVEIQSANAKTMMYLWTQENLDQNIFLHEICCKIFDLKYIFHAQLFSFLNRYLSSKTSSSVFCYAFERFATHKIFILSLATQIVGFQRSCWLPPRVYSRTFTSKLISLCS